MSIPIEQRSVASSGRSRSRTEFGSGFIGLFISLLRSQANMYFHGEQTQCRPYIQSHVPSSCELPSWQNPACYRSIQSRHDPKSSTATRLSLQELTHAQGFHLHFLHGVMMVLSEGMLVPVSCIVHRHDLTAECRVDNRLDAC